METWKTRTELLIGQEGADKLSRMHVLQVGLGGVGAFSAEMLCRAGVGEMTIVDADNVSESNLNRQLPALHSTLGKSKAQVMADRLLDINPQLKLHVVEAFIRDERTEALLDAAPYDYVLDAIDSLSPKVYLIYQALQRNLKVLSVMGAGGKMDPSLIRVADISKSSYCHLAKTVRKRLYRLGVRRGFLVVYSSEHVPEHAVVIDKDEEINKLSTVGTISYMPAAFGCFAAAAVIRELLGESTEKRV
ncbi:MAG: tRNA threonylcarbamoyladenosine dehydratase [Bacteroidales bacterium]|nr:tRNA threonylcarbamoyladenosine dehydratase [Bacteroidales bacterium]MBR6160859.1 tRNA threonylcarbamoyladenosine dehydratase [Bacteroidales bacterium]